MKKFNVWMVLVLVALFALVSVSAITYTDTDITAGDPPAVLMQNGRHYRLVTYKGDSVWNLISYTSTGVGSAGTGVTSTEYGDAIFHQTVLTGSDVTVVMAEGGEGTNGVGSVKIYDFPAGRILVLGVTVDSLTLSVDTNALDAADGGDFSFGTAAAGGASGLSSTEVDICPSTSFDPVTNVVSSALASSAQFDGTTTAKDVYLNLEIDDGDIAADCTNTVNFVVRMSWIQLGDY